MPNHITNILTIYGTDEQVDKVLEFIKNDELGVGTIDFNKITPMPPWIFQGNLGREDEEKYGEENCWYDWSIKNWGTKWNAYGQPSNRNTENKIHFETAWSNVLELIRKLSWVFPDVEFFYQWADEDDIGANVGSSKIKDGELYNTLIPPSHSTAAYKMAFEITGQEPEDYGMRFDDEKMEYVSIEEE